MPRGDAQDQNRIISSKIGHTQKDKCHMILWNAQPRLKVTSVCVCTYMCMCLHGTRKGTMGGGEREGWNRAYRNEKRGLSGGRKGASQRVQSHGGGL